MIGGQKWSPFFVLCSKIAFNFRYIYMKLKLSVPNSLKEIQLKQYQEFLKAQEESDDPKFIASKIMQIFCGISLSETVQVKMSEINRVSTVITEMFDEKPSLITSFKMNGVEYTKGDIIVMEPYEATDFEAIEDSINTVVKFPGANDDKYLGEPNHD